MSSENESDVGEQGSEHDGYVLQLRRSGLVLQRTERSQNDNLERESAQNEEQLAERLPIDEVEASTEDVGNVAPIVNDVEQPSAEQQNVEQVAPAEPSLELPSTSTRIINLDWPSPPNKRMRYSSGTAKVDTQIVKPAANASEESDGMTCSICLQSWEMSGDHRLVSLRCGHLFGNSCIRRWLLESIQQSSMQVCPQCKMRASHLDIRYIYAERVRAIDRSEEQELRRELNTERRRSHNLSKELATAQLAHSLTTKKLNALQLDYESLQQTVRAGGGERRTLADDFCGPVTNLSQLTSHRLHIEKHIEIARDAGCRVLLYSAQHSTLVASQASDRNLFLGYGVRFIDPLSFVPLRFLHTSNHMVRDMAFSDSQHLLSLASREEFVRTFDIRTSVCSGSFSANGKKIWSCGLDRNKGEYLLYAGDSCGGIYMFDVRSPDTVLSEIQSSDNLGSVMNIAPVPAGTILSNGGFLVCQLCVVKVYDYVTTTPTVLSKDGPFFSMKYDAVQDTVMLAAGGNNQNPHSRFILGQLKKVEGTPVLNIMTTVFGSTATPYTTRPTQLAAEDNTLIVGYLQDKKQIMMYDVRREERIQSVHVNETIFDICPVGTSSASYLAVLADNNCRIYRHMKHQTIF